MSSSAQAQDHEYVRLSATALQQRCNVNRNKVPDDMSHPTRFHSSRVPSITMPDYFKRIAKYSHCSPECHIIALIYIQRYCNAKGVNLTFRNIHRLVIVSVMVAAKLRDDIYYSNAYYASIGGVSNREINDLEVEFMNAIDWVTWVGFTEFDEFVAQLGSEFGHDVYQSSDARPAVM